MDHPSNMKTKVPQINKDIHIPYAWEVTNDSFEKFPKTELIWLLVFLNVFVSLTVFIIKNWLNVKCFNKELIQSSNIKDKLASHFTYKPMVETDSFYPNPLPQDPLVIFKYIIFLHLEVALAITYFSSFLLLIWKLRLWHSYHKLP